MMVFRRWGNALSLYVLLILSMTGVALAQSSSAGQGLFGMNSTTQQKRPVEVLGFGQIDIPTQIPEEAVFALDEPIDPATYILGPGDVIGVNLRSGTGWFYQSMITPDGHLLIPRLPMIQIGGMTLADAMVEAQEKWSGDSNSQVDVTVLQMRRMRVTVAGAVNDPGEYIVTPADRASTVVELAGGLIDNRASDRRAWLTRKDGTRLRVDLLRFLRSGITDINPRLMAGDNLMVEAKDWTTATVSIGGGVLMPGTYEYLDGDKLMGLIDVAGGLRPEAIQDSIELIRFNAEGPAESKWYSLSDLQASGEDPALDAGDLVNVRMVTIKPNSASVTIRGEVNRPGVYPIVAGETKLSEVMRMAGGFTADAYLPGGRVFKERPSWDFRNVEAERIDTLMSGDRDELDLEFLKYYFRSQSRDYMPVEMEEIFNGSGNKGDVVLFDSLIVNVPRQPMTVLVAGQVKHPGFYPYEEGRTFGDYIDLAGGYARGAHKSRSRLVGYDSPLWQHPKGGTQVEAGSMLFVPVKQVGTDWELFRDLIAIILQFATLYLLAVRTLN